MSKDLVAPSLGVEELVSAAGGVVSATRQLIQPWGDPRLAVHAAYTGDATELARDGVPTYELRYSGAGRSRDPELARDVAIIEALERYSASVCRRGETIEASAAELGADALDLTSIPRPSALELADPCCPLSLADHTLPIRWVEGLELQDARRVWLPAVMVFMSLQPTPTERFWLQISTGCAAHSDVRTALASAIMEVVERDAVALTWLQELELPPVDPACLGDDAREAIMWSRWRGIETRLFDATTNIGVPTVYALQSAPADLRAAQLVGCATAPSLGRAALKAVTETSAARAAVHGAAEPPPDTNEFHRVLDGAAFLGRPENRKAFAFLLDEADCREPSWSPDIDSGSADLLNALLNTFSRAALPVYAADLTTREADAVGICVVRVIIPALQPLSFRPPAQYRGHPRLYEGPRAMGYPVHPEPKLNPWPQPFP